MINLFYILQLLDEIRKQECGVGLGRDIYLENALWKIKSNIQEKINKLTEQSLAEAGYF